MFWWTIIILIIAAVASFLKELYDYKEFKLLSLRRLPSFLIIVGLILSIILEFCKKTKDEGDALQRENEYMNIIAGSDTIKGKVGVSLQKLDNSLTKADSAGQKIDSSLHKLDSLQNRSKTIIANLSHELAIQQQLNNTTNKIAEKTLEILDSSKALVYKNEKLFNKEQSVFSNVDRITNPFFPIRVSLSLFIPFGDLEIKELVDSMYKIKEGFEKNRISKSEIVASVRYDKETQQVINFSIIKPDTSIVGKKFGLISGNSFIVQFISKPSLQDLFLQKHILDLTVYFSPYRDIPVSPNVSIDVDFRHKRFGINYFLDEWVRESSENEMIGVKDIADSYLVFSPERPTSSNYSIWNLDISTGSNSPKYLTVDNRPIDSLVIGNDRRFYLFKYILKN